MWSRVSPLSGFWATGDRPAMASPVARLTFLVLFLLTCPRAMAKKTNVVQMREQSIPDSLWHSTPARIGTARTSNPSPLVLSISFTSTATPSMAMPRPSSRIKRRPSSHRMQCPGSMRTSRAISTRCGRRASWKWKMNSGCGQARGTIRWRPINHFTK